MPCLASIERAQGHSTFAQCKHGGGVLDQQLGQSPSEAATSMVLSTLKACREGLAVVGGVGKAVRRECEQAALSGRIHTETSSLEVG